MANENFEVDLTALQAEVSKMSLDEFKAQLLKTRTSQKKTQMKQSGSDSAKRAAAKARERNKLFKARAVELGLWEGIEEQATAQAKSALEQEAAEAEA